MNKVIAVDFDGCLCKGAWPEIGEARLPIIRELLREQHEGTKLILWTCREGEELEKAILWCRRYGLWFDAVNDNLPEHIEHFGNNSRKVYATEYWDDKSVIVYGEDGYCSVLKKVEEGGYALTAWGKKKVLVKKGGLLDRIAGEIKKWL